MSEINFAKHSYPLSFIKLKLTSLFEKINFIGSNEMNLVTEVV